MRQRETCDRARHAHRECGVARFFRIGLAFCVEKHRLGRGRRRGFAIVDRRIFTGLAEMDHHEAAAADIACARISHRERETDRHRGIDRVATTIEHFNPDTGGTLLLRHHHAVVRQYRLRGGDDRRPRDRRDLGVGGGAEHQRDQD